VLESEIHRWRYDSEFADSTGPNVPPSCDEGELKFAAPDKAWMKVETKDPKHSEQWLCDGRSIFQWDYATKTVHEWIMPPKMQGEGIGEGPLPFVFGVEAEKLKQRYFMRIITPHDVHYEVWLEAYPKFQRDAAKYRKVQVILQLVGEARTVFPFAIQIYLPNGKDRVVYQLQNPKTNWQGALGEIFDRDWTNPSIPIGWSKRSAEYGAEKAQEMRAAASQAVSGTGSSSLAFGPVTNRLQAALELRPTGARFALGQPIGVSFHIRNNSSNYAFPLTGAICKDDDELTIEDEQGLNVEVHHIVHGGRKPWKTEILHPGETVIFQSTSLAFVPQYGEADKFAIGQELGYYAKVKPGKYSVHFRLHFPEKEKGGNDGWHGDLETAPVTVNVMAGTAETLSGAASQPVPGAVSSTPTIGAAARPATSPGEELSAEENTAKAIQGTWEIVSTDFNLIERLPYTGQRLPFPYKGVTLDDVLKTTKVVITGATLKITGKHVFTREFDCQIKPGTQPKLIDLVECPPSVIPFGPWKFSGIYKFESGLLKICVAGPYGAEIPDTRRATEFSGGVDSQRELLVLRRVGDPLALPADEKGILGDWQVERLEPPPQEADSVAAACGFLPGNQLVISPHRIEVHVAVSQVSGGAAGQTTARCHCEFDPTASPKRIDLSVGPGTAPGIYELGDGRLSLCWQRNEQSQIPLEYAKELLHRISGLMPPDKIAAGPDKVLVVLRRVPIAISTVQSPSKAESQPGNKTDSRIDEGTVTRVVPVPSATKSNPPTTDAERAVARLVLVFFGDRSRRAVPAVLVNAGSRTLVVTTGPATEVPNGSPPAIDRAFLESPGRPPVESRYMPDSTKELFVYRAVGEITRYRPDRKVVLGVGDVLSAIIPGSSPELSVAPNAVSVVALDRQANESLPKPQAPVLHYDRLIEVDRSLPEGTPLFKDGKLAGLVLLGSRFLGETSNKSYVVPVDRIAALCSRLEAGDEPAAESTQAKVGRTAPAASR
jgi:TIGR03009 family protein